MSINDTNRLLGKLLGETYRLQRKMGVPVSATEQRIFGLLNGFDEAIERELEMIGHVPTSQVDAVRDALDGPFHSDKKFEAFKGYYDIEDDLKVKGVDRSDAIKILRYLAAGGDYTTVIEKISNSQHTPIELKGVNKLGEWDK